MAAQQAKSRGPSAAPEIPGTPAKKASRSVKDMNGRQKAAVFLVTLGSEISAEIFKHLREDEIETLTFEIARLDTIEPEQKDAVLTEFQELMMAQEFISSGGIDYARELLEKALGSQKAIDVINRLTSSLQVRPFDFIRRTDPAHLLNFIQTEHPQTISLILAYLEPGKAAYILQKLPHEVQSDVAKRIASMGYLDTFKIDQSGVVTAVYSNGSNRTIGQIALGSFTNPGGLEKSGETNFVQSNNSGMKTMREMVVFFFLKVAKPGITTDGGILVDRKSVV